eukprot:8060213-Pyramimonas_sp.AAC.2
MSSPTHRPGTVPIVRLSRSLSLAEDRHASSNCSNSVDFDRFGGGEGGTPPVTLSPDGVTNFGARYYQSCTVD